MTKVLLDDSNLSAIGNAIREKTGSTDTYKPREMAEAIAAISGVNLKIPVFTGDCTGKFKGRQWDWLIEQLGDQFSTENITTATYMFGDCYATEIPFEINLAEGAATDHMFYGARKLTHLPKINGSIWQCQNMFDTCINLIEVPDLHYSGSAQEVKEMFGTCQKLEKIGTLYNFAPSKGFSYMFCDCWHLKEIPEFVNLDVSKTETETWATHDRMFFDCYSLRSIPPSLLKQLQTPGRKYNSPYSMTFYSCYALDEIVGLSPRDNDSVGRDQFHQTFGSCHRLKRLTFDVQENGAPYSVNMSGSTIDLTTYIGYLHYNYKNRMTDYNSGITADKEVTDAATYAALKNDPDWWTADHQFSRYNRDSAVETINTLPDTSAWLAAKGGTNTIKFKGEAGLLTDGGAINTLTEAEIAVAAAKGWTVTFS